MSELTDEGTERQDHADQDTVPAIAVTDLHKHYGDAHAVDGVDLTMAPGEVVALLGPNGAGKSTMIDMILGLTRPTRGTVRVFGRTPAEAIADGVIGAMLQDGQALEDAKVSEVVGLVASLHRRPLPVGRALEMAGIAELANQYCTKLSGGQFQRVRYAIALVSDPKLLILDEPTTAMDVKIRRDFWKSMHRFTDAGRTVLFATHYLDEAEEFSDRIIVLQAGRVIADGSVADIRAKATGRTLHALLPQADLDRLRRLPGVITGERRGDRVELHTADSDATIQALLRQFPDARDIEINSIGLEEAFLTLTEDASEETRESLR